MASTAHNQYDLATLLLTAPINMIVLNAAVLWDGALASHDTASGEIKPFDGTQTDRLVGFAFGDDSDDPNPTGDAVTGSAVLPRVRAKITTSGVVIKNLAVATLANDATDYGKPVFATDDNSFTITDPTSGIIVGHVVADDDRVTGQATVHFVDFSLL